MIFKKMIIFLLFFLFIDLVGQKKKAGPGWALAEGRAPVVPDSNSWV